jgi:hypothetical protein
MPGSSETQKIKSSNNNNKATRVRGNPITFKPIFANSAVFLRRQSLIFYSIGSS